MQGVGKGRRMPVQQSVDVAVPFETAYNQWTQFEDWPELHAPGDPGHPGRRRLLGYLRDEDLGQDKGVRRRHRDPASRRAHQVARQPGHHAHRRRHLPRARAAADADRVEHRRRPRLADREVRPAARGTSSEPCAPTCIATRRSSRCRRSGDGRLARRHRGRRAGRGARPVLRRGARVLRRRGARSTSQRPRSRTRTRTGRGRSSRRTAARGHAANQRRPQRRRSWTRPTAGRQSGSSSRSRSAAPVTLVELASPRARATAASTPASRAERGVVRSRARRSRRVSGRHGSPRAAAASAKSSSRS